MQIQSLRIKSYRSGCVSDNTSKVAIDRLKRLELYAELKLQGCNEETRLKVINASNPLFKSHLLPLGKAL